ncbi:UDP-N-acetylmuramoyl-L-alanine--D-glutamate ligase [Dichotomicrobium thermohalophilum]|uniref:UDP-N-acetylmuramoylalanine--D-glutamate ligase n=1 Tax=Dichotomicrobium thermohalophilum TaxID=933063 RepID=A0A397PE17_9HYPH|nr:UDP-N-acetylmuramoyl-L-alanine--D-glutamate ligase [Dichotomicrobium thermohalophilum]RIA47756.1 UDP-N-acetylmuramoylalanine--D-glutamate ligase [Dichotomicrobium thermohalophilum]
MIPITVCADWNVAVFGLGLSGIAAARALALGGAKVVAWDDNEPARAKANEAGVLVALPEEWDWSALNALVLSPGVPLTHPKPHVIVEQARAAGVEVIGDTELFCRERRHQGLPGKVVAITGTNGKSTTSALTAHLLSTAGRDTALGGNIGKAVLDLPPFAAERHYVLEYSSFQIDLTPGLDADVSVLLNVQPDHLDRHGTLENYAAIKARIFNRLGAAQCGVIGVDSDLTRRLAEHWPFAAARKVVSTAHPVSDGVYVHDGLLFEALGGVVEAPISLHGIPALRGAHNWENAAAAYAAARALGLSRETIIEGLRSFPGLAHRMEEVGRLDRVAFINDSKATNADAAARALACFDPIFWIVGGRAKEGGLAGLDAYYPRVAKAYLIGEAAEDFAHQLDGHVGYERCGTLENAVAAASRDALRSAARAPVVLLSPACASYDQFPNFAERGEAFRRLVAAHEGVSMREAIAA